MKRWIGFENKYTGESYGGILCPKCADKIKAHQDEEAYMLMSHKNLLYYPCNICGVTPHIMAKKQLKKSAVYACWFVAFWTLVYAVIMR